MSSNDQNGSKGRTPGPLTEQVSGGTLGSSKRPGVKDTVARRKNPGPGQTPVRWGPVACPEPGRTLASRPTGHGAVQRRRCGQFRLVRRWETCAQIDVSLADSFAAAQIGGGHV